MTSDNVSVTSLRPGTGKLSLATPMIFSDSFITFKAVSFAVEGLAEATESETIVAPDCRPIVRSGPGFWTGGTTVSGTRAAWSVVASSVSDEIVSVGVTVDKLEAELGLALWPAFARSFVDQFFIPLRIE